MGKQIKTNAMRLLDARKVPYQAFFYTSDSVNSNGTLVAQMNKRDVDLVHKTLVARSNKNELFVFIIPIDKELDLKKAAVASGSKKIEMLPHKDLFKYTAYEKGGCSPIGMKKLYRTFLDSGSEARNDVIVSGGRKGCIIEIAISDLLNVICGEAKDLVKQ